MPRVCGLGRSGRGREEVDGTDRRVVVERQDAALSELTNQSERQRWLCREGRAALARAGACAAAAVARHRRTRRGPGRVEREDGVPRQGTGSRVRLLPFSPSEQASNASRRDGTLCVMAGTKWLGGRAFAVGGAARQMRSRAAARSRRAQCCGGARGRTSHGGAARRHAASVCARWRAWDSLRGCAKHAGRRGLCCLPRALSAARQQR
jgi:hypothetical protein